MAATDCVLTQDGARTVLLMFTLTQVDRKIRLCLVCSSAQNGERNHLWFDCPRPVYSSSIAARCQSLSVYWFFQALLPTVKQTPMVESLGAVSYSNILAR